MSLTNGGPDIHLHIKGFAKNKKPAEHNFNPQGARVEFEMGTNRRTGKPCAMNARLVADGAARCMLIRHERGGGSVRDDRRNRNRCGSLGA